MSRGTRRLPYLLAVLLSIPPVALAAAPPVTARVGATMIHPELGPARAVSPDTTVLLSGERSIALGPSARAKRPFRPAELVATVR